MYIFGGKDEDNEKLKDLWSFDLINHKWTEILCDSSMIVSRSGHSSCVYKDYMILFGGIHEVTKELDDMIAFSFKKNQWIILFKEYIA